MKHKPKKKIKVSKNDHESVYDNAQPILEPNTLSSFISYHVLYISKHELNTMTLHYSNTLKIMGHARERGEALLLDFLFPSFLLVVCK